MKYKSVAQWRKSSHSSHQGGDCVEVAEMSGGIGVRDSKHPSGPVHTFGKAAFQVFAQALREGRGGR